MSEEERDDQRAEYAEEMWKARVPHTECRCGNVTGRVYPQTREYEGDTVYFDSAVEGLEGEMFCSQKCADKAQQEHDEFVKDMAENEPE